MGTGASAYQLAEGSGEVGAELPVRPLTAGEVLDAAVAVLRQRPWRLLGLALLLAGAEQAALYRPMHDVLTTPHNYFTSKYGDFPRVWDLASIGAGTETAIFVLLGAVAAPAGYRLLTREGGVDARLPRTGWLSLLVLAAVVGGVTAAGTEIGLLPGVFWFMITGLVAPALIVEGKGLRALGRSLSLSTRHGLRPGGLRLMAYLSWVASRLLIGLATPELVRQFNGTLSGTWWNIVDTGVWILVDAVAYAVIACVDTCVYLEVRMRHEGLDIWIARGAARRTDPVVTR